MTDEKSEFHSPPFQEFCHASNSLIAAALLAACSVAQAREPRYCHHQPEFQTDYYSWNYPDGSGATYSGYHGDFGNFGQWNYRRPSYMGYYNSPYYGGYYGYPSYNYGSNYWYSWSW